MVEMHNTAIVMYDLQQQQPTFPQSDHEFLI